MAPPHPAPVVPFLPRQCRVFLPRLLFIPHLLHPSRLVNVESSFLGTVKLVPFPPCVTYWTWTICYSSRFSSFSSSSSCSWSDAIMPPPLLPDNFSPPPPTFSFTSSFSSFSVSSSFLLLLSPSPHPPPSSLLHSYLCANPNHLCLFLFLVIFLFPPSLFLPSLLTG